MYYFSIHVQGESWGKNLPNFKYNLTVEREFVYLSLNVNKLQKAVQFISSLSRLMT